MSAAPNYKDSLTLPQTNFPMRGDLVENEPKRLARWENEGLYEKIIARRRAEKAPEFILHDGPPFANGDVHMGTALNKVLKDLVVKSKTMAGFTAPFIPGWDCHGLPIEFKVVRETAGLEPGEIRRRCSEFAQKFIVIQRASFRRLGVFGDWENPYLTMNPGYEASILRVCAKRVEIGAIYQAKKPVQWSYGAQTALAEAEINLDMIVSNIAHYGFARHSFTMPSSDLGKAQAALKPVLAALAPHSKIETEAGIAKLSAVGIGMRSHSGVAATMFKALGAVGINIGMISTSEIKIAVTVDEAHIENAARAVHDAFGLDKAPQ